MKSIPPMQDIRERINPLIETRNYEDWPFKIIYASDGVAAKTLVRHLDEFYEQNQEIPTARRPDVIHVAGKYVLFRISDGMEIRDSNGDAISTTVGEFYLMTSDVDVIAIAWVLDQLQKKATTTTHIVYNYENIMKNIAT